ncbi:hypothetical protein [Haliangium ochraceum]|uniref:Uncharacterized protein n=1 Tax=Haliangium ochraceum (strain DSM 14365 / JCM 11303 / SMP-2) TaxID=502025 RepID=D0LS28_HALO1|nr:hypothetical protein [Haliangium ochraceum]ACY13725.1 hypothetical protein Hoch_1155 [Haliangium ochraceum DSM 14365]
MKRSKYTHDLVLLGLLWAVAMGLMVPGDAEAAPFGTCRDDTAFRIDLDELYQEDFGQSSDERIEQIRDWIWPVLLGRLEASSPLTGLLISDATAPLVRDDALAHVLDHAIGSTRAAIAEDGTVVIMVGGDAPEVMQANALETIDREALHRAATPERVLVYRYDFDHQLGYADMCRVATLDARWIESRARGFRRARIRSVRELNKFLRGGVDLLSAQCSARGLEVTGRSRSRARKTPVTAEHIAALAQRVEEFKSLAELGVSLDDMADGVKSELAQWKYYFENRERIPSHRMTPSVRRMFATVAAWQSEHPTIPLGELLLSWFVRVHTSVEDPGFSLDPELRASEAAANVAALLKALDHPEQLAALFYRWEAKPETASTLVALLREREDAREFLRQNLRELRGRLSTSSDGDAMGLLHYISRLTGDDGGTLLSIVGGLVRVHTQYQCARYDGPLQGTETGMTLFYTDLLMKLWSSDHFDAAPDGLIPGFESEVAHTLSGAYCTAESKAPRATRYWLDLRNDRYTREAGSAMRFAPVVTRIFSKGSEFGAEYGEEEEAGAGQTRFVRWWNAHYARVAEWEPQYELLNQIMKWSMVVQNGSLSPNPDCLAFLDDVQVERTLRFDRWVAERDGLRWRGPLPVVAKSDEPTECMATLRSRPFEMCGGARISTGGVSLGGKAKVLARTPRGRAQRRALGRVAVAVEGKPTRLPDGGLQLDEVHKVDGTLRQVVVHPKERTFSANIETAQSQRGARHAYGLDDSGGAETVQKSWHLKNGTLDGRASVNERFGVGHLHASDIVGPRVAVRVDAGDGGALRKLGNDLAIHLGHGERSLADAVAALPEVARATRLADGRIVATLRWADNAPRHVLMSTGPIRGPPSGVTYRFGGTGGNVAYELRLLDTDEVDKLRKAKGASEIVLSSNRALPFELHEAVRRGDLAATEKALDDLWRAHPEAYEHVDAALGKLIRFDARDGVNVKALEALRVRALIRYSRRAKSFPEQQAIPADGGVFYVPRRHVDDYSELVAQPPGASPGTGVGRARPSHHARVLREAEASPVRVKDDMALPATMEVDGVEYARIERRGYSLSRGPRRVYVIHPCRSYGDEQASDGSVPCYGRSVAQRDEAEARERLLRMACSAGAAQAQALGVSDCSRVAEQ